MSGRKRTPVVGHAAKPDEASRAPTKDAKPCKARRRRNASLPEGRAWFVVAAKIETAVEYGKRDYERSLVARKQDDYRGRAICNRTVCGVPGRAHSWCVDFHGTPHDLIEAGLALPDWFDGSECRRIVFRETEIELFRRNREEFEVSLLYGERL